MKFFITICPYRDEQGNMIGLNEMPIWDFLKMGNPGIYYVTKTQYNWIACNPFVINNPQYRFEII